MDTGCCGFDWLEFQNIDDLKITDRTRFCSKQPPGHLIDVYGSKIRIVFTSDGGYEERGFWISYNGLYIYSSKILKT